MSLTITALSVLEFLVKKIDHAQVVPEEICAEEDLPSVHDELASHHLIIEDDRLAGNPTFRIAPGSRTQAKNLAKKYRPAAIQLGILTKIEENNDRGTTDDYFTDVNVGGEATTQIEYRRAVEQLFNWKLIKGTKIWGGAILRPEVTADGFNALESGYAPQDWVQSGGMVMMSDNSVNYTMNNSGTIGAAQQGESNTANFTQQVGIDAESFSAAIQSIRETLDRADLSPQDLKAAHDQLELIEEQAEAGKPTERIRNFFHMLTNALPKELAGEIAGLVGKALESLPG